MTIGIYIDTDCLTLSEDMDYSSYNSNFDSAMLTWNEAMERLQDVSAVQGVQSHVRSGEGR
jgi:hypothetical protein